MKALEGCYLLLYFWRVALLEVDFEKVGGLQNYLLNIRFW